MSVIDREEIARSAADVRWPRISIVVPTFNGGKYLEGCLESLLGQGYPDLEIIVMDGGSTDESVEILKRYGGRLSYWESERDRGQSHAINKGMARATGEVVNWLNSDDRLMPGALEEVGRRFAADDSLDVLVGGCYWRDLVRPERSGAVWTKVEEIRVLPRSNAVNQPSCFYRRKLLREPAVDETFHYAMDTELWAYFLSRGVKWGTTEVVLSEYLWTGENKTMTGGQKILREVERVTRKYHPRERFLIWFVRYFFYPVHKWIARGRPSILRRVVKGIWEVAGKVVGRVYGFEEMWGFFKSYLFFDPV